MEDKRNFLIDIIDEDINEGRLVPSEVHTRFPPEPNGYLHIGSAKAICINSGIAQRYGGKFNLRYDDTNPMKESDEFVQSIYKDICWLGAEPTGGVFFGSDYFEKCYEFAVRLIKEGKAYVCDLSKDDLSEYKGTDRSEASKKSPYRNRSVEENLDLFERMKNGEFPDGSRTLRAKIDPASDNFYLRDPVIYRIRHVEHHRQGSRWCIYPMYDFAHPIQDALEGITHSLCSIEFENHRPLYEWVVDNIDFEKKPKQREFARLNLTYTLMSKRYLRYLVEHGFVDGWDDPRMPTLCALRRRGYTPESIRDFVERAGVAKAYSVVDIGLLEHCIREELNAKAQRRIAVTKPVKVVITNYPEGKTEYFDVSNNPTDPDAGTRKVPFTRELWIEEDDFALDPPPKFHRLKVGGEVRLMSSYIIKCEEAKVEDGKTVLYCTADLETGNGNPADGRKIKGTIHWLSVEYAKDAKLALYGNLFTREDISDVIGDLKTEDEIAQYLDRDSVTVIENAKTEPSLAEVKANEFDQQRFQFVRTGYFVKDFKNPDTFIRIVGLKDSFTVQ